MSPSFLYLDVPAKGAKLLPLLDNSMEEAETKHQFAPVHTQDLRKGARMGHRVSKYIYKDSVQKWLLL